MRKTLIFACITILATACDLEKEIDIDMNYDESIFIGGQISRKYGASVYVMRTLPPYSDNDAGSSVIEDAKVYLTSGGEKIAEMKPTSDYKNTLYHIEIDTLSYNSYGVLVESESLGRAYSTEQILPTEAVPDSIVFSKGREGWEFFALTKFYFTNDSTQAGYYCNAYIIDDAYRHNEANNPVDNNLFAVLFFGDTEMEYQKKRLEKDCHIECDFNPKTSIPPYTIEYHADFITLSPDLAKYLKSQNEYSISKEDEFFENPYIPYSNIKGGYGIFGAFTVHQTCGEILAKDYFGEYEPLPDTTMSQEDSIWWAHFYDSIFALQADTLQVPADADSIQSVIDAKSIQSTIKSNGIHIVIGDGVKSED